jgi:hypothetical protein
MCKKAGAALTLMTEIRVLSATVQVHDRLARLRRPPSCSSVSFSPK